MTTLAAFLIGMVGPLAARLLTAFGVSLITLTGFVAAVDALKTAVTSNISGLPAASIQLAGLFGFWEALGMFFGCITFIVTWRTTKGFMAIARAT